jgi:beta-lactamase regulating signal transducer with metallopeptidase domain
MRQLLEQTYTTVMSVAQNARVASTVAVTTVSSGTASSLDWIPDDIGKLGTIVGMALSFIVIYAWTITIKIKRKDNQLKKQDSILKDIQIERDQLELNARKEELNK